MSHFRKCFSREKIFVSKTLREEMKIKVLQFFADNFRTKIDEKFVQSLSLLVYSSDYVRIKNLWHFCNNELEKFFDESFLRGIGDISDYGFQSLKNSLDNISHVLSIKPVR